MTKTRSPAAPLEAIIIGSGFGGQCAAINLMKRNEHDFLILERRSRAIQRKYRGSAFSNRGQQRAFRGSASLDRRFYMDFSGEQSLNRA